MRGRYQGVMSISWSTAMMIGPSVEIALYQVSPVLVWAGTFVLAMVAALLTLAGGRSNSSSHDVDDLPSGIEEDSLLVSRIPHQDGAVILTGQESIPVTHEDSP